MAFKKGQSGNPDGRPKGAKDKVTSNLRKWIDEFLSNNRSQIESDIAELSPSERVKFFLSLMNYVLPKRQAVGVLDDMAQNPLDLKIEIIDPSEKSKS